MADAEEAQTEVETEESIVAETGVKVSALPSEAGSEKPKKGKGKGKARSDGAKKKRSRDASAEPKSSAPAEIVTTTTDENGNVVTVTVEAKPKRQKKSTALKASLLASEGSEDAVETKLFGDDEAPDGFEYYGECWVGEKKQQILRISNHRQRDFAYLFALYFYYLLKRFAQKKINPEDFQGNASMLHIEKLDGKYAEFPLEDVDGNRVKYVAKYGIRRIEDPAQFYEFPKIARLTFHRESLCLNPSDEE